MKTLINYSRPLILLCLTLGLAPFFSEPNIVGKIRWIACGAVSMTAMDYSDVLLHGFPFVLLLRLIIVKLKR